MKRVIGIAILGVALGGTTVASPPTGEGPREGRRGHRAEALVEFLGLTPEQQAQWTTLREQHREAMKAFREEGRELRQRVREALDADQPDAMVGEAVKAMHAHRAEAKKAREAFETELVSLLDDAQKTKLEAFKAARGTRHEGRRGRGPRRGFRAGHGGAWGEPPIEG